MKASIIELHDRIRARFFLVYSLRGYAQESAFEHHEHHREIIGPPASEQRGNSKFAKLTCQKGGKELREENVLMWEIKDSKVHCLSMCSQISAEVVQRARIGQVGEFSYTQVLK